MCALFLCPPKHRWVGRATASARGAFSDGAVEENRGRLCSIAMMRRLCLHCIGSSQYSRLGKNAVAPMLRRERSAFLELLSNINELYIIGLLTIFAKSDIFISVISTRMKRVLTIPREGG